jgi:LPXTG-motif cell wall-anchored protein
MINNEPAAGDQAEVVVEAGKTAEAAPTVSFTNNLVNTSIRVIKVRKGTETPVTGAKFVLTRVDEEDRAVTGSGAYSSGEQTVDSNGILEFTGLWDGRYKLEETFTPDGYITKEGPYYITINMDGEGTLDTTVAHTMISPETGNEYTVENEPGAALPNTGGSGIARIYLFGIILTGFAGAGLVMRKQRRTV